MLMLRLPSLSKFSADRQTDGRTDGQVNARPPDGGPLRKIPKQNEGKVAWSSCNSACPSTSPSSPESREKHARIKHIMSIVVGRSLGTSCITKLRLWRNSRKTAFLRQKKPKIHVKSIFQGSKNGQKTSLRHTKSIFSGRFRLPKSKYIICVLPFGHPKSRFF